MSQPSSPIVIHGREAADSFDFNARHGRALQAQGAREGFELLRALFGWRRGRRATSGSPWEVVWPAPEPDRGVRPQPRRLVRA